MRYDHRRSTNLVGQLFVAENSFFEVFHKLRAVV